MSYEDAPATRLADTRCAACGRKLVDAQSLEAGMGPDCRKRYGLPEHLSEASREEANKLINGIAREPRTPATLEAIERLRELGAEKAAARIEKRLKGYIRGQQGLDVRDPVEVWYEDSERFGRQLVVRAPYHATFVEETRALPGRFWAHREGVTRFHPRARAELWRAIKLCYHGHRFEGPQGSFTIGERREPQSQPESDADQRPTYDSADYGQHP